MVDLLWPLILVGAPFALSFALWSAVNRKRPQRHLTAKIVATAVLLFVPGAVAAGLFALFGIRDGLRGLGW